MLKNWKLWAGIVAAVVIGFFGLRAYQSSRQGAAISDLQTVEAGIGDLTARVGATGSVHADQSAVLTFQTSGTVEAVYAVVGDSVAEGELLASLAQTSLPANVILAQADLVSAQRALDNVLYSGVQAANAMLALAQAEDALADAEYRRTVQQEGNRASTSTIRGAQANLVLAEAELDSARAAFNHLTSLPADDPRRAVAQANLTSAQAHYDSILRNVNWYLGSPTENDQMQLDGQVALARAQYEDAQREWDRLQDGPDAAEILAAQARVAAAQATLDAASIQAPFSGTIASVQTQPGDQVSPGTFAFDLVDTSRMLVDVSVSEVDINRIALGQEATLLFDSEPNIEYAGEVVEVGYVGREAAGIVNYIISVELTDPDENIRPGMTAAVNIIVEQIENVLLVPNRAVRTVDGERVVYILQGSTLERRGIVLGASSDLYSEVLDGELAPGDLIVLNPPLVFEAEGPPAFVR
ncbi:MAG: efflux RND transporter periplasmic adaptor subunit [Anaerolineales bacterium]|nr:efflux RND transporter periplasmic adaptor subunit [Anaerolineales bacterium]